MDIENYVGTQTYAKTGSEIETFPFTIDDLRKDNSLVSFPTGALQKEHIRSEYGVTLVTRIDSPEAEEIPDGKVCKRIFENRNGEWVDAWEYRDMTPEELDAQVTDYRKKEYGPLEEQIEFITENGLSQWQSRVAEIKARFPK